ncbi:MAG: aquaporin, partial [Kutzneria sp.]|nr:aquaporin [Kutzneria sp.]
FGPLSGASVNLARTFGPDVVLTFAGSSANWTQFAVYLVGPVLGGLVAAYLSDWIGKTIGGTREDSETAVSAG